MKKALLVLVGFVCLFSLYGGAQVPRSRHVWIVGEENHSFEDAAGSMPYLMSLGEQYGIATQYYADMHNSISALMHLTAGQTVTTDDSTPKTFDVDNIVRQLLRKGLSFRSYQEQLPQAGFLGLWSGPYVKRHNPLAYFTDVANSNLRNDIVPIQQLASDLANHAAANYNYVTPDLNHDAHDGSLRVADEWLHQYLPPILAQPEFQPGGDGLLFVVFDEGNLGSNIDFRCNASSSSPDCGGRVLVVVAGPNVKPGFQSPTFYNHESLLATVCQALGTDSCPGAAVNAAPIRDVFVTPLSASPGTGSARAGQPARFSLRVEPVSGFYNSNVKFSCAKLPPNVKCSFFPATVQSGSGGGNTTLTISVPPSSWARLPPFGRRTGSELALWLGLPGLALLSGGGAKRKSWLVVAAPAVLTAVVLCFGCGGGAAPPTNAAVTTRQQTYTVNVVAQSSSASYSVPVQLRVTN